MIKLSILRLLTFKIRVPRKTRTTFLGFLLVNMIKSILITTIRIYYNSTVQVLLNNRSQMTTNKTIMFTTNRTLLISNNRINTNNLIRRRINSSTRTYHKTLLGRILRFNFHTRLKIRLMTRELMTNPPLHTLSKFLQEQSLRVNRAFQAVNINTFLNSNIPHLLRHGRLSVFLLVNLHFKLHLNRSQYHSRQDTHRNHNSTRHRRATW